MSKKIDNETIIEYSLEINFTQPFYVREKFVLEKTYHKVMAKTKSMIAIKNTNAINEQMILLYQQDYKDNHGVYSQIGKISSCLFDISDWKKEMQIFIVSQINAKKVMQKYSRNYIQALCVKCIVNMVHGLIVRQKNLI